MTAIIMYKRDIKKSTPEHIGGIHFENEEGMHGIAIDGLDVTLKVRERQLSHEQSQVSIQSIVILHEGRDMPI